MKKLLTGVRVTLLIIALAFVGIGMMPAESAADHGVTCDSIGCTGGDSLCGGIQHDDGSFEACFWFRDVN